MAAVYDRSLNLSVTYSVKRSSCSVVARPVKKKRTLRQECGMEWFSISLPMVPNKVIGSLSSGKARPFLGFGMDKTFASFNVLGGAGIAQSV
jgi:hypothetical protein